VSLRERNLQPELMDQPDLDPQSHQRALLALRRINVLSRTAGIVWPALRRLARQRDRPLRVLDIASGGGDVTLGIWRRARRANLPLEIVGLDMSPVAVEHARSLAKAAGADIEFRVGNVLDQPLPADFDVIMTSLFLHHLTRADAERLLAAMAQAARHLVVVNDLRRSTIGYLLAQAVCRVITRSPVVRVDGPRSVAGAFTLAEIRSMCAAADLTPISLRRRWPWRFLLTWERL
jgi:2-polyprenyl-3-methyl-5-hydroxy-6-metoxy-1,4-benzoquinol methylase